MALAHLEPEESRDRFLIPVYNLTSLLSLNFTVLPAKVITFLESPKLFVEESKPVPVILGGQILESSNR